ncbi:MAG: IS1634 family transposase [Candidatus Desulforudis sp.]|nr:IS1634 family transposase [Bacillota bacterium]MBV1735247.1 IS1634 family transposase [Desulforudis sp.]
MYARKKTFTNKDGSKRTYLQLVESVRENGKVRQKVVANLGRLDDLQEKKLDQAIESLAKFSKANWVRSEAAKLMVKSAREWGSDLIFGQLWERLGLSSILTRLLAETEIASPLDEAIYAMVLNRVCDPLSKRAVYKWISEIYRPSFDQLELQHFYRGLDFLIDHKETIENALFSETRSLFNMQLDMVFWDSTSTYFEGVGPDGLADYGHSKDHRPDRTQIVVGLLMTREGIPIAHQVFPGNMADIDTFKEAIKDVRDRFMLRRVIFVADRGMVSPQLLDELDLAHIEYIVGVKMRRSSAVKAVLKTGGRYRIVKKNLQVKEVWHEVDRYIVCYNPEEAKRDRLVREEMVRKLEAKLQSDGPKSLIDNRGYRRYLKVDKTQAVIDQKVLKEEARYDGKYALRTNSALSADEAATAYKQLWRVEQAFRELKSTLDLRPVYHWKDRRVRAHVMVCFLALVLESALQRSLKLAKSQVEYTQLIRDLQQLRAVELTLDDQTYLCRTELPGNAYEAFRVLGIRPPQHVTPTNR